MNGYREMKRNARRQLHERMSDAALYLASPTATPVAVTVRLHLNFAEVGELLRGGFAERQEVTPSIIFMRDQVSPAHNGIVITKDMGAWRVDNDSPPDDITVKAEVVPMTDSQVTQLGWDKNAPYMGFDAPEFA